MFKIIIAKANAETKYKETLESFFGLVSRLASIEDFFIP